jgi:hypothetical protein
MTNMRPKFSFDISTHSPSKLAPKYNKSRELSPKRVEGLSFLPSFYEKIVSESVPTKKV